jgi:hypothetical protein
VQATSRSSELSRSRITVTLGCSETIRDGCAFVIETGYGRLCVVRPHEEKMNLEVDCYSGRKADERPVRFRLDGHEYLVEEVLDQWYGPQDVFYKVRVMFVLQKR